MDPVLADAACVAALERSGAETNEIAWLAYLSSTGVYGDHAGKFVDETSPCAPTTAKTRARLDAEQSWAAFATALGFPLRVFRLGGVYGPRRSLLDAAARANGSETATSSEKKKSSRFSRAFVARCHVRAVVAEELFLIRTPHERRDARRFERARALRGAARARDAPPRAPQRLRESEGGVPETEAEQRAGRARPRVRRRRRIQRGEGRRPRNRRSRRSRRVRAAKRERGRASRERRDPVRGGEVSAYIALARERARWPSHPPSRTAARVGRVVPLGDSSQRSGFFASRKSWPMSKRQPNSNLDKSAPSRRPSHTTRRHGAVP